MSCSKKSHYYHFLFLIFVFVTPSGRLSWPIFRLQDKFRVFESVLSHLDYYLFILVNLILVASTKCVSPAIHYSSKLGFEVVTWSLWSPVGPGDQNWISLASSNVHNSLVFLRFFCLNSRRGQMTGGGHAPWHDGGDRAWIFALWPVLPEFFFDNCETRQFGQFGSVRSSCLSERPHGGYSAPNSTHTFMAT